MSVVTAAPFDSPTLDPELEENVVNTIRMLALDAVQAANSGHAGLPMGMATAALTLWRRHLRYSPTNPEWANRDRFILSAGHGSMLLYALLHLTGYDLPLQQLKNFRQWGSQTPGHPEYGHAPGVETTTGPLGQGFANGVGMAIAEQWLAANYNRPGFDVVSHHVFAIVSDGDLMEGVAQEAASLAGHLRLGKLIYLYDDNHVTIDGYTDLAFTEDQYRRFEAYGWHVQKVDGMDSAAVDAAIGAAKQDPRPSLIGCTTIIGFGAPKQGEPDMHSDPLPAEEVAQTKASLEWPQDPTFYLPPDVSAFCLQAVDRGKRLEGDDCDLWEAYAAAHPEPAAELAGLLRGELPDGWEEALPVFEGGGSQATRNASGDTLNALAPVIPNLIGGSADLAPSNKTIISGSPDFQPDSYSGRNFRFGVREHGMGAVLSGMALHGGGHSLRRHIPGLQRLYAGQRAPCRVDGGARYLHLYPRQHWGRRRRPHPSAGRTRGRAARHPQSDRNSSPADANEVTQAWKVSAGEPRRAYRVDPFAAKPAGLRSYRLFKSELPTMRRRAGTSFSTVRPIRSRRRWSSSRVAANWSLPTRRRKQLAESGAAVRVVSLPSWELFAAQSAEYQREVLPPDALKVSVEAGVVQGWERWVGNDPARGAAIGLDRFGASAPQQDVYANLGLTVEAVVRAAQALLET